MPDPIFIIDIGPDGGVATHPLRVELPVLVAPIPEDQKPKNFNTVRQHLVAIGCMLMPDGGFEFDSSFIGPDTQAFNKLAKLMLRLQNQDDQKRFPPCSVFGHADPVGKIGYNKTLSGRRALSVYAVLTRNVKIWDTLFNIPCGGTNGDRWGMQAIQKILSVLKRQPPDPNAGTPFYTGPIDGLKTKETTDLTRAAVGDYLEAHGFARSGYPNQKAREVMFAEYMDVLCHKPDGTPFVLNDKTDFIAKHKDKDVGAGDLSCGPFGLKGDVQGCSHFNPIFLLANTGDDAELSDDDRNDLNAPDRRVIVYIFKHGSEIDPKFWPCPRAREGPGDCSKRFWSDHEKRRGQTEDRRTFGEKMQVLSVDAQNNLVTTPVEQTGNTMRCRFYHAFAVNSPCEVKLKEWIIRFRVDTPSGQRVLANRRYVLKLGETDFAPIIRDSTDDFGFVRIPVLDEQTKMTIKLDAAKDLTDDEDSTETASPQDKGETAADHGTDPNAFPDEDEFIPMVLDGGVLHPRDTTDDLAVKQRLYNLGFGENAPDQFTPSEFNLAFLAYKHRRNLDSADDDTVRQAIFKEHDLSGGPAPPSDSSSAGASGGTAGGGNQPPADTGAGDSAGGGADQSPGDTSADDSAGDSSS